MDSRMPPWRHEYKYVAPEPLLAALERRTGAVMRRDPHTGGRGFYAIRSVYFDDLYDTCFHENEDGTDPREKFRIRIYNGSRERITLELKQKRMGRCRKLSAPLPYERCARILAGGVPDVRDGDPFLYKKLCAQMQARRLRPVAIVCYERVPFVWAAGNVRVTFDRNIRSADDFGRFFEPALPSRPVLPAGTSLMEVKFDSFLPDFIYELLQAERLGQTAFSKYYLCRKYARSGMPCNVRRLR